MRFVENTKFRKASEDEISKLEDRIQMYLPENYKFFLLKNSGGIPIPDRCPISAGIGEDKLQLIYSIIHLNNYDFSYWGEIIEVEYIPIGVFTSSSFLLMSLNERTLGEIFYWDCHTEEFEPPTFNALLPVADTISDLLLKLY